MTTSKQLKIAPADQARPVQPELKAKMKRMRHLLAAQGVAALNAAHKHGPHATP